MLESSTMANERISKDVLMKIRRETIPVVEKSYWDGLPFPSQYQLGHPQLLSQVKPRDQVKFKLERRSMKKKL